MEFVSIYRRLRRRRTYKIETVPRILASLHQVIPRSIILEHYFYQGGCVHRMDAEDQTLAILSVVAGTRLVYIEVIG